jgi:hypothetical protein
MNIENESANIECDAEGNISSITPIPSVLISLTGKSWRLEEYEQDGRTYTNATGEKQRITAMTPEHRAGFRENLALRGYTIASQDIVRGLEVWVKGEVG